ncbi:MAG: hypothetical protein K2O89_06000 [Clostridia bacterium]|nr:hypothetical protein [Clostridia bacterium]
MKKKSIVCGVLASSVALAATLGGCSLVSTNTAADMNQQIALVDISNATALSTEFSEDYVNAVGETSIIKRELVAYFINYGYSYVQNYGYTYEQTFNLLLDSLIENAVLVQYSTMYLLKELGKDNPNALNEYVEASKKGEKEKYEYLLGENSKEVKIAKYNLYNSINSAIDTREEEILKKEDSASGTDTRTTPDGVDTQKEDYYPQKSGNDDLDYGIYTGYQGYLLEDSGAYKKDALEGTTIASRIKAYNEFISSLASSSYDLVDTKTENLRDVLSLNYIQDEYVSQLEQCVINKYYDVYEEEQEALLKQLGEGEDEYKLINSAYRSLLNSQKENYEEESNFTSAMDSMSDTSFVLYAPETDDTKDGGRFGYVYNILLPFSTAQSDALKVLQSLYADSDLDGGYEPDYYVARNKLLKSVKTTDQRAAWFNGETEYAFNAKDTDLSYYGKNDGKEWLFFENNIANSDKYEALDKYVGLYPYNGTVIEKDDDYLLIPNELTIDQMLTEFENYISFVTDGNCTANSQTTNGYYDNLEDKLYKKDGGEFVTIAGKKQIDYSNFVYAKGSVNFGNNNGVDSTRANLLNRDGYQYRVLSAVNELQYAYTTDTGVLSQYIGYSVQAGDTSYIKEFEYAAHEAVKAGAGTYYVCAGDYGWHLIYVTYTFDIGEQYGDPQWSANIETEGTFENLFYEWYKSNTLSDISTKRRSQIITDFKVDATVTKYESRYKNLLELDND